MTLAAARTVTAVVTLIIAVEVAALVFLAVGCAVELETGASVGYMFISVGGFLAVLGSVLMVKFRPILGPLFDAFFKRLRGKS